MRPKVLSTLIGFSKSLEIVGKINIGIQFEGSDFVPFL